MEKSSLSSGSGQSGCFVVLSLLYSKLYILYIPYSFSFFKLIEDSKKGLFVGCNNQYLPCWKFKGSHFHNAYIMNHMKLVKTKMLCTNSSLVIV